MELITARFFLLTNEVSESDQCKDSPGRRRPKCTVNFLTRRVKKRGDSGLSRISSAAPPLPEEPEPFVFGTNRSTARFSRFFPKKILANGSGSNFRLSPKSERPPPSLIVTDEARRRNPCGRHASAFTARRTPAQKKFCHLCNVDHSKKKRDK